VSLDPAPQSAYLAEAKDWSALGKRLLECTEVCGLDTETIGCNPEEDTAVDYAKCVVWSVGIPDGRMHPRGYRIAEGFVLPPDALDDPYLYQWLTSPDHTKVCHNNRYDRHVLENAGVKLVGLVDSCDLYRVICPGRERYSLKSLVPDILGVETFGQFKDIFSEAVVKETTKTKRVAVCTSHGDQDRIRKRCEVCRDDTVIVERTIVNRRELKTRRRVPLQEVCGIGVIEGNGRLQLNPGESSLWNLFVNYAGADAVWASQLFQARSHQYDGMRRAKIPAL
jgi:hypothetical protein